MAAMPKTNAEDRGGQQHADAENVGGAVAQVGLLDQFLQAAQQANPGHQVSQEGERAAVLAAQQLRLAARPAARVGANLAQAVPQLPRGLPLGHGPDVVPGHQRRRGEQGRNHEEEDHLSFTSCSSWKMEAGR
jgi:hypothetical protein